MGRLEIKLKAEIVFSAEVEADDADEAAEILQRRVEELLEETPYIEEMEWVRSQYREGDEEWEDV